MAINDEIAAGVKPIQMENPLNNMVKMYGIKNDMQTNEMNRLKMAETQRAQAQAEDTRNFFRTPGLNIENMTQEQKQILASKDPALFEKLMTQQSTQKTQESEAAKRAVETRGIYSGHYADEFSKLTNPQEAASLVSNMYDNVHMKDSPIHGVTKEQALARIPQDVNSPEWLKYIQQNSLNAKDYAQSQLLEFRDMGDATQGFNKTSGLSQGPSTAKGMTPKEQQDAFPGLAEAQAERKQLAADIKQGATNMQNTASSPELASVFKTQQAARYEELAKLDKDIIGMQTQAAQGKHASAEFLQVSARLEQLRAVGQQNSPEGKALQARIAKETYIPPASSELSEEQNNALYGPNGAVTTGRLDPYKVNGRNAKIYANAEIANPGTNMNQLAGTATLNRNAQFMGKQLTIEMLPKMLSNMSEAGKKLNFNDNKYFGAVQAWYKGASNDPDFISYMAQRNDVLLTLMGAMRSVGASDLAHRAEIDAAPQNMSPRAFDAYVAGQYKALEPRLAQAAKFTGSKPPAETPNAPAQTRTGATVSNWK